MVSALTRPVELPHQPGAARRELAEILEDASWEGDVDGVMLAVHEAMVNAQRHGGGVTKATAGFEGSNVVVEIADRGRGFDVPDSPGIGRHRRRNGPRPLPYPQPGGRRQGRPQRPRGVPGAHLRRLRRAARTPCGGALLVFPLQLLGGVLGQGARAGQ